MIYRIVFSFLKCRRSTLAINRLAIDKLIERLRNSFDLFECVELHFHQFSIHQLQFNPNNKIELFAEQNGNQIVCLIASSISVFDQLLASCNIINFIV